MKDYYQKKLTSGRLKQVYDLASPRVRQYLDAELRYALNYLHPHDRMLDLGCGYGRQFPDYCRKAAFVVGIDSSAESLAMGREYLNEFSNFLLIRMNARTLLFPDQSFDIVLCLQNGISAFHIDQRRLVREAIRVTKKDGTILFSSYSGKFWKDRLHWFQLQSDAGLLGKIDYERTKNGNIVCEDGFTATTFDEEKFQHLLKGIPGIRFNLAEVDCSSLFCEIKKETGDRPDRYFPYLYHRKSIRETMEHYEKILQLDNEFEAERMREILEERKIPFAIIPRFDSALGGITNLELGWGYLEAPQRYRDEILTEYQALTGKKG